MPAGQGSQTHTSTYNQQRYQFLTAVSPTSTSTWSGRSAHLPLSPVYDGPYQVLERSTHFFLLEMGERTEKVSTLRLKVARTPADTEPAKLPRRDRPVAQAPPVRAPPPTQRGQLRQVTFNNIINVSIRPPASQCPAAEPTQPLSLPQSLGGTCGGVLSVPATFPALIVT